MALATLVVVRRGSIEVEETLGAIIVAVLMWRMLSFDAVL
jgi:hypothetical protein